MSEHARNESPWITQRSCGQTRLVSDQEWKITNFSGVGMVWSVLQIVREAQSRQTVRPIVDIQTWLKRWRGRISRRYFLMRHVGWDHWVMEERMRLIFSLVATILLAGTFGCANNPGAQKTGAELREKQSIRSLVGSSCKATNQGNPPARCSIDCPVGERAFCEDGPQDQTPLCECRK